MRKSNFLSTTLAFICIFALMQTSHARDYIYAVYLTGIECRKESDRPKRAKVDNPFVIAFLEDARGKRTSKPFPDGTRGNSFGDFNKGTIKPLSFEIWRGSMQTIKLDAQLFEFNGKERRTKMTLLEIAAVASIAIAFADGPISGAGEGLFLLSMNARDKLIDGGFDFMGNYRTTMELHRAGALADKPQHKKGKIGYDFTSRHTGDGADYILYWDVRRG